jgi:hypothetical protein
VQTKSAFVLTHKLRESLLVQREEAPLYVNTVVRAAVLLWERVARGARVSADGKFRGIRSNANGLLT